ncbi:MAG: hypothetical protein GY842_09545 [bacterium]|nr:hypothetical protein [bacterium]
MPFEWEPAYRDERSKLIDGEHDYSKSYDKYLLTLSGGALALSVTFTHDIIGDAPVRAPALIVLAWIAFALSVAATLVSIQQSGPLFRNFRDIMDRMAQHAGNTFSWTEVRTEQSKLRRLALMDWLNNGSLVLFLLGVILLLSFTRCNLGGATSMAEKAEPQPKVVNEGAKPARAPVDVNPTTTVSPGFRRRAGKPPLAPVDVAPPNPPPAEPAPPQPAPSEPTPTPPSDGKG